ncbi:MAG: serine/threonine protein kinase [Deltaproteobacteria bacterium]|nr:serine/threonine protein kinase [Deltaproteobacteria bacterium]
MDFNTPVETTANTDNTTTRSLSSNWIHNQLKGKILLGKFRLNSIISKGGMGSVYLARNIHDGNRYAVKILRSDLTFDPKIRERFLVEYRAASALSHPSIIQTYDVGETSTGELFLIMEYVDGPPLRRLLKRAKPLPVEQSIMISAAIAEGLQVAHKQGIIHRDLKPENILVPRNSNESLIKISDFGIARILDTPNITTTHHVLGTPSYMSPEQAMGTAIDQTTDIYSLGIIMYELFSGKLPFTGETPQDLLTRHIKSTPVTLKDLPNTEHICDKLENIVMKCLKKYPDNRPQDMAEIIIGLEECMDY